MKDIMDVIEWKCAGYKTFHMTRLCINTDLPTYWNHHNIVCFEDLSSACTEPVITIVCQMCPWWTKKLPYPTCFWDNMINFNQSTTEACTWSSKASMLKHASSMSGWIQIFRFHHSCIFKACFFVQKSYRNWVKYYWKIL